MRLSETGRNGRSFFFSDIRRKGFRFSTRVGVSYGLSTGFCLSVCVKVCMCIVVHVDLFVSV